MAMGMIELMIVFFIILVGYVLFCFSHKIKMDRKMDRYAIEELERLREKVRNEP